MDNASRRPEPLELAARVQERIRDVARLGVAFSGGADSSVLLALALRELGPDRVVALLGVSPSLAARERKSAHEVARALGARLVEIETHEGDDADYRRNGPDRCFFCKQELFRRIDDEVADRFGLTAIAYGENADDVLRPDRPGSEAARRHAVLAPLADAGLTKADVRAVGRALGVPSADKPAAPCLASRVPHLREVTPEILGQIERAEDALHDLGYAVLRVRHHGTLARVELGDEELVRVTGSDDEREAVVVAVRAAGFEEVEIDPRGLRSGANTLAALEGAR
ncbi:ATP-dependent sacrificial sulfur transferase LarE [Nostocoides sp. F2B08]|uniref:ATP-dependent sacrificial sulfur transferase LarE n=1 Tax=Nostocoides sp. F2B08 TaxID=2653936 RepID=UPI001D0391B4|nr:ATP-dependent sacrificial sulfur transferase LarE [Tetrasphaera sp. F2B08]